MTAAVSKASILLLPALRQYMHNDGSGLLPGYDCAEADRIVDQLLERAEAAEALADARIEEIPLEAKMVTICTDLVLRPELREQFEEFAETIKKRCTSGRWTLVAFFPADTSVETLSAEQMSAAGIARAAPPLGKPIHRCASCDDDLCGGAGIYQGRPCNGVPF